MSSFLSWTFVLYAGVFVAYASIIPPSHISTSLQVVLSLRQLGLVRLSFNCRSSKFPMTIPQSTSGGPAEVRLFALQIQSAWLCLDNSSMYFVAATRSFFDALAIRVFGPHGWSPFYLVRTSRSGKYMRSWPGISFEILLARALVVKEHPYVWAPGLVHAVFGAIGPTTLAPRRYKWRKGFHFGPCGTTWGEFRPLIPQGALLDRPLRAASRGLCFVANMSASGRSSTFLCGFSVASSPSAWGTTPFAVGASPLGTVLTKAVASRSGSPLRLCKTAARSSAYAMKLPDCPFGMKRWRAVNASSCLVAHLKGENSN